MKGIIPNKRQWERWSLPSKLTAIGVVLGVVGIVLTLVISSLPSIAPKSLGERLRIILDSADFVSSERQPPYVDNKIFLYADEFYPEIDNPLIGRQSGFKFYTSNKVPVTEKDMLGRYYFVMLYHPKRPCNRHVGITKRVVETLRPYMHLPIEHMLVNIGVYEGVDGDSRDFEIRYGLQQANVWMSRTQPSDSGIMKIGEDLVIPIEGYSGVMDKFTDEDKDLFNKLTEENKRIRTRRHAYDSSINENYDDSILKAIGAVWKLGFSRYSGIYSQTAGLVNADGVLIGIFHLGLDDTRIKSLDDVAVIILRDIARSHPELLKFDLLTVSRLEKADTMDELRAIPLFMEIQVAIAKQEMSLAKMKSGGRLDMCNKG